MSCVIVSNDIVSRDICGTLNQFVLVSWLLLSKATRRRGGGKSVCKSHMISNSLFGGFLKANLVLPVKYGQTYFSLGYCAFNMNKK